MQTVAAILERAEIERKPKSPVPIRPKSREDTQLRRAVSKAILTAVEIGGDDVAALRWYFSKGISAFQHSTFGHQLEIVEATSSGSRRCNECKGDGVIQPGTIQAVECWRCHGVGAIATKLDWVGYVARSTKACPECRGVCGNPECPECLGEGYVGAAGVFCDTEHLVTIPEPDGALMKRYGKVARVLDRIHFRHRAVFERVYGDVGERWARTDMTRLFSLYDATVAGRALLAAFASDQSSGLPALERLGVQAELDKRTPIAKRTNLLAKAFLQANQIHNAAAWAWVDVSQEAGGNYALSGS